MSNTTISSTNNADASVSSTAVEQLVCAKIGAAPDFECIPSWDKGRIAQAKLVSFLDDPSPENEKIRVAKGIVGGPDSLVVALQPDSPQYVPVSGMTLEAIEEAVFSPPSKEREFFFDSQNQKERDSFRASLDKAAGQGEDASEHFDKLVQFVFRKVVVALRKGILRQVLIMQQEDGSVITVLQHRGLYSAEAKKIEKLRERIRAQRDPKQTKLNFPPVPRFAEEEKGSDPIDESSSESEEDLLSSEYGDLFAEDIPRLSVPSSLFKRRKIAAPSSSLSVSSTSNGSNAQVIYFAVPFGSILSPLSFLSMIRMFEEQLRLPECSSAELNAMDTP